jgi:hypothetical protein
MTISAMNTLYVEYLEKVTDANGELIHVTQKIHDLTLQLNALCLERHEVSKTVAGLNIEILRNRYPDKFLHAQETVDTLTHQIEAGERQLMTCLIQRADKYLEKQMLQIKANLFANEAYICHSAVYHILKGMLNKSRIPLSKQTVMGSALQQIGFRLLHADELRKANKAEEEIAYYCAKYGKRVFDLLFNNTENVKLTPFLDEQIEALVKNPEVAPLKILPHLKAIELQSHFKHLFTREEYHLLNSEVKIIAFVKRVGTIPETDKAKKTLELLKERLYLINQEAYPDKEKITAEQMRNFVKTTENRLFKSIATKLMAAVYITKLDLSKGYLWGQVKTTPSSLFFSTSLSQPTAATNIPMTTTQPKRVWMPEASRDILYPILDKLSGILKLEGFSMAMPPEKFQAKISPTGWQLYSLPAKDEHWAVLNFVYEVQADAVIEAINTSGTDLKTQKMKSGEAHAVVFQFSGNITPVILQNKIDKIIAQLQTISRKFNL